MKIKANDRVLFAGKTGSGKTWLARRLLANTARLIVIDPKISLSDWNAKEPDQLDWYRFLKGKPGRLRILPPIVDKQAEWYEKLFEELYDTGDFTLYIDEAYAVVPPGSRPGKWLSALYTRGREKGIGVWTATQRPAWIPLFMISEADWYLVFRLNLIEDRVRLSQMMGDKIMSIQSDPHGLWLFHTEDDAASYFKQAVEKA